MGQNLPQEFVKINWVSSVARERWQPIFTGCSNFFTNLEIASVRNGLRRATIQTCPPEKLEQMALVLLESGLTVTPIDKIPKSDIYASSGRLLGPNEPWDYKVAIGKFDAIQDLAKAYKNGDNQKIGWVLGYPNCCIEFFNKYWVTTGWIDTSYLMSQGIEDHYVFSPYCNILLRWLGVRYVSHLPCSFECGRTAVIGDNNYKLAVDLGWRTAADELLDILSWPVEWSGLHGIGFVTTPVCRVTFRTDMYRKPERVRLHGKKQPKDGAYSLTFPHKDRANPNGFYRQEDETRAHNLILDLVRQQRPQSVIDLGCGDGGLLHKMKYEFKCITYGVDMSADKNPNHVGNIFDLERFHCNFDMALISKARIRENPVGWYHLLRVIEKQCKQLVLYSYDNDIDSVSVGDFKLILGISDQPYLADLYGKAEET